ncbi:DUF3784 domain-containing protein [Lysinibacillus fusiformis]|uniref:DUF3784 domain-containing protein n=1 Tax=Lysinibacillus fusiformis TaxID=28031 RepID=UPI0038239DDB
MGMGIIFGVFFIWAGYIVRTKREFFFLAGFRETWQPINKERLGNRIGILLIIIAVIALFASIFTIWFGAAAEGINSFILNFFENIFKTL